MPTSDSSDKVFAGSVPALYEQFMVPLIFEPYAKDLVTRVAAYPLTRVLEIAAGTGVVTRRLASALGADVAIVATDLNPPMLAKAAAVGTSRPVEWKEADAMQLPFADASFDAVVCQFGAMFFPDKPKAFAEARRVLRSGGVLLFNVWDRIEENEFADVVTRTLASRFPDDPPRFLARTPHGYHDVARIRSDLAGGGFDNAPASIPSPPGASPHRRALPPSPSARVRRCVLKSRRATRPGWPQPPDLSNARSPRASAMQASKARSRRTSLQCTANRVTATDRTAVGEAPANAHAAVAGDAPRLAIRAYGERDFDAVVDGWHTTNRASYPYVAEHQRHTLEDARVFFREHVLAECRVWIAQRSASLPPIGMLALQGIWIRQLAVFPGFQRQGAGSALLAAARDASPAELRLYTFRRNATARAFYARHGFVAVAFGVSPAPESEPDVEMRWVCDVAPPRLARG